VTKQLDEAIEDVVELDEDRILRAGRQLILATTRTNYFQRDESGQPKPYVTLKFDPSQVPDLPPPLPRYETFVFSARTEGIHLRAGDVARGGIRWSTRLEDYRTEVLGLMTTQVAKNAVIVPTGAKGGFIAKRLTASNDRSTVAAEVAACYRLFIAGLLDVMDNLVDTRPVGPPAVVSYDHDGTYLVVAADKGTATFSDVANAISQAYGFWLGDAFASGGSAGYDHKAMGITARGAWESVARHFRGLGLNVGTDRFTVVGIGDMSGDVFGNGMLLSRTIALVGAFDHRHLMLDPNPDPASSWLERKRLFDQPASSWADYDPAVLSPGGAVYSRAAKAISPSPEVRRLLDLPDGVPSFTPNELIRRLLCCPVDLLWNGGIGTFVKASSESQLDAADKVNDGIRVDADEVRCRVIGEGGNLGLTPLARIELALAGCRLMSDAIDNSAGVATSDVEVNIKILLDAVVANGDLTTKQRDEFLEAMTDEVAQLVLSINYAQGRAIENELAEGNQLLDVHERLIGELVLGGQLDRSVEPMPDTEALADRHQRGIGLTAPEMSAVLAYTKNALKAALVASDLGPDPFLGQVLLAYFPSPLRQRFATEIANHPLRRELLATMLANRVIDRGGMTLVMRLADETGAAWVDVARAHTAAWELFSMSSVWDEVAALDGQVASEVQTAILLRGRRLVERSTRWLLRQRRHPIDVTAVLEDFGDRLDEASRLIERDAPDAQREAIEAVVGQLVQAGVGVELARRSASHDHLARSLDIIETSRTLNHPLADAASAWFRLESRLGLAWLNEAILALPRAQRWESLARSALRDELSHTHAELTATLLGHVASRATTDELPGEPDGGAGSPVDNGAVDGWLGLNAAAVGRVDALREAIAAEPQPGVEPLTVILRELRSLAGG
jgi:glutamate dehydrogenase